MDSAAFFQIAQKQNIQSKNALRPFIQKQIFFFSQISKVSKDWKEEISLLCTRLYKWYDNKYFPSMVFLYNQELFWGQNKVK